MQFLRRAADGRRRRLGIILDVGHQGRPRRHFLEQAPEEGQFGVFPQGSMAPARLSTGHFFAAHQSLVSDPVPS